MRYLSLLCMVFIFSCNSEKVLPENTGSDQEIILVIDDNLWESEVGKIIKNSFSKEIKGLPQSEFLFKLFFIF